MTALTLGRAGHPARRPARMLRLEIKHSPVSWVLPLLAALFLFDSYRTAAGFPAIWTLRASAITDHMLFDFSAFACGLSAWVGSREGRRNTTDLVATTARPTWARQAAALAGTLFWVLLGFLGGVAVLYIQTARQATWGGPPLWPVAVGVVAVVTVGAIGFTCGALFPGRFTAPLAAIAVLVLNMIGFRAALGSSSPYALLSPATSSPPVDAGLFYRVPPDVAIAQVMFMGGITIATVGVLALAPTFSRSAGGSGRWLRAVAAVLVAAGVAASATAFGLTATAQPGVAGWAIPALHDAADDQPAAYTPDCAGTAFRVCLHPAFGSHLGAVAAALDPVAAEIAGLPGAPVRAEEVASVMQRGSSFQASVITGTPPVFDFSAERVGDFRGPFWALAGTPAWRAGFRQGLLDAFVAGPSLGEGASPGPAQQAVVTALMSAVRSQGWVPVQAGPGTPAGPSQAQVAAAAQRFAALSPAARHAWLAARLAALRAGHVTLAQLP
jgi:hypothetical protein